MCSTNLGAKNHRKSLRKSIRFCCCGKDEHGDDEVMIWCSQVWVHLCPVFFWHRACFLPRFFCFILIATVTLSWVFWMHLHCIWRRFLYILVWFPCFFSVNAGIWCRMSAQRISIPLWRTKRESLAKALGWARIELWVGSFGCQRYFTMENNKLETHFHRQNHAGGVCGNSDKMPG